MLVKVDGAGEREARGRVTAEAASGCLVAAARVAAISIYSLFTIVCIYTLIWDKYSSVFSGPILNAA